MKYADLHMHTHYSDGRASPTLNVRNSALLGIEAIAITDHDTTAGVLEGREEASGWGIYFLIGVEISTPRYHILGYEFDIEHKVFQRFLDYSKNCQERLVEKRILKLREQGIPLTMEKLKMYFPESRLGRFNIAMGMMRDPECRRYLGHEGSVQELFSKYLRGNSPAHSVKSEEVCPHEAINMIHSAGGYAILAHPAKDVEDMKELDELKGIDGLEIQPTFGERYDKYRKAAEERGWIITFGSDYHGADYLERPLLGRDENLVEEFWKR